MHRSHRLLGIAASVLLATSALGAAGLAPASASTSDVDTFAPVAHDRLAARAMPAGSGFRPAARSSWPVGSRTGALARETGVSPAGDASQNFTSVRVAQKRAQGSIEADIQLAAAPTAATNTRLRIAFGRVVDNGTGPTCTPTQGSYVDINSFDVNSTGTTANPAYAGAHIVVKPTTNSLARNAAWNCAYALTLSADATVLYDSFIGGLVDHIQKPQLSFVVAGKKLGGRGYTRVPIKIINSAATIATAPAVRLSWRTRGVSVRANPKVGSITPGHSKKGYFYIKDTRRGTGKVTFTASSKDYRSSVTLTVRPT